MPLWQLFNRESIERHGVSLVLHSAIVKVVINPDRNHRWRVLVILLLPPELLRQQVTPELHKLGELLLLGHESMFFFFSQVVSEVVKRVVHRCLLRVHLRVQVLVGRPFSQMVGGPCKVSCLFLSLFQVTDLTPTWPCFLERVHLPELLRLCRVDSSVIDHLLVKLLLVHFHVILVLSFEIHG